MLRKQVPPWRGLLRPCGAGGRVCGSGHCFIRPDPNWFFPALRPEKDVVHPDSSGWTVVTRRHRFRGGGGASVVHHASFNRKYYSNLRFLARGHKKTLCQNRVKRTRAKRWCGDGQQGFKIIIRLLSPLVPALRQANSSRSGKFSPESG